MRLTSLIEQCKSSKNSLICLVQEHKHPKKNDICLAEPCKRQKKNYTCVACIQESYVYHYMNCFSAQYLQNRR